MNDNTKKIIGKRIATAIADNNITQKELAEHLNVKPNVISEFCKGGRVPNAEQIIIIADYFNISSDYLLGRTDIKTTVPEIQSAVKYVGLSETSLKAFASHLISSTKHKKIIMKEGYEKALNKRITEPLEKLFMSTIFFDYLINLRALDNASKKFIDSETSERFDWDDKCDLLRYRVFKLNEKILDQFDRRENIGEHNGKQG